MSQSAASIGRETKDETKVYPRVLLKTLFCFARALQNCAVDDCKNSLLEASQCIVRPYDFSEEDLLARLWPVANVAGLMKLELLLFVVLFVETE